MRWLHIYLSLLGFTALVFFAVTGITLNHPTWFGVDRQHTTEVRGEIPRAWLQPSNGGSPSVEDAAAPASAADRTQVDRLAIAERLRQVHGLHGTISEFRIDEEECTVVFRGPAYSADVTIDRSTGTYSGSTSVMGFAAIINDLHKGRDTGLAWKIAIDACAILMVLVSLTGFALIFFLRLKRKSGLITAVAGTIVFIAIAIWCAR